MITNMAPTSFMAPSLTDLVPTLVSETDFKVWSISLKWAIDSRDIRCYQLLNGSYPRPVPATADQPTLEKLHARNEWDSLSRHLLPLLNATVNAEN